MENSFFSVIGVMSGTSLDGLDIAQCEFSYQEGQWDVSIEKSITISYSEEMVEKLSNCGTFSGHDLNSLDISYGKWIGKKVQSFITDNKLEVSLICSHGHTVFHQPNEQLSLQIGNLNAIYSEVKITTVNNFRQLDILKGGQGAPLVPIGDQLLFPDYTACINLGGIANISHLDAQERRVAYDISVCNLLLNRLASTRGLKYDKNGSLALKGVIDEALLQQLNAISYYAAGYPKSLGTEKLNADVFPIFDESILTTEDKLATAVEHIAIQIGNSVIKSCPKGKILITGGGAHNIALMNRLTQLIGEDFEVAEVNNQMIDYKEAMVFAFLGLLRIRKETNVLSSVTGASSDSIAGDIIGEVYI